MSLRKGKMKENQIEKIIDKQYNVHKKDKVRVVALRILMLMLGVVNTFFYNYLIDKVFVTKHFNRIAVVFAGMILLYLIGTILGFLYNRLYNTFMFDIKESIRLDLIKKLFINDGNNSDKLSKGEMKNIVDDDVENVEHFYKSRFIELRLVILTTIVYLFFMVKTSLYLSLFCLILLPISYISTKKSGTNIEEGARKYRLKYGEYENYLLESINNWREIKSYNIMSGSIDVFLSKWDKMSKIFMKNELVHYLNSFIMSFNRLVLIQSVVYAVGGYLLVIGKIDISLLLIFVNYYSLFLGSITQMSTMVPEIKGRKNSVERVIDLIEDRCDEKLDVDIKKSDIEFQNVSYAYPKSSKMALDSVSFSIEENEFTVLSGKSGSGKSTIIKLLSGECNDFEGKVYIGGYDIQELSIESIAKKMSVVMQDSYFFNCSIKENLLIAKKDATDEEIYDACKKANIIKAINRLPEKMNTIIGENASILSGGQKQQLAIARAILRNTDIILFDEITSALDFKNEKIVADIIYDLAKSHTIVCATHKEIIKEKASKKVLIEYGKIIS
ncbi:ABC transporter ATP-binding protein [Eubacterium sp.]